MLYYQEKHGETRRGWQQEGVHKTIYLPERAGSKRMLLGMASMERRAAVFLDGEFYNSRELRTELKELGEDLETDGDAGAGGAGGLSIMVSRNL